MRTLIVPCAGQSTRYDSIVPKYQHIHPSGKMMVYESIQGLPLNSFDRIIITVLEKHINNDIIGAITDQFKYPNFEILVLHKETISSSETVMKTIVECNIDGEIYIKDADDYFEVDELLPNQVYTVSLDDVEHITPGNKSYVRQNKNGDILTIIEKKIISSDFCCGLYSFKSSHDFVKAVRSLNKITGEIYISHIIFKMLLNGMKFSTIQCKNFIDWGTQEDWDLFKIKYEKYEKRENCI